MASRNRTLVFRKYRDALRSVRIPAGSSTSTSSGHGSGPVIELATTSLLNPNRSYAPLSTEDPGTSSNGPVTVGLPPAWVDLSDEITANVHRVRTKMSELAKAHAKALMPSFGDGKEDQRRIEALTHEITDLLKRSEKKLQRLSAAGLSEDSNVRKNVQRSLATDLQSLSMELRRKQSTYLKRLQQQKEGPDGVALTHYYLRHIISGQLLNKTIVLPNIQTIPHTHRNMKASLTKEDEAAFYNATVKGGTLAGIVGLAVGTAGVYGAQHRYTLIRNLTLPFKVFLAVSTGSFAAIIGADRSGRAYEAAQHPDHDYHSARAAQLEALDASASQKERAMRWASDNRYSIVFGSWVASMGAAFAMVSRSPMNTAQKLVQARVYAQGLTMAVVIASLALEGADMKAARSEGKDGKVTSAIKQKRRLTDADQWMDMVEAEEERMKEREARKI